MPHTQLFCCQSAARVPLPPTPQAQPEIRARSCRQSRQRSSHSPTGITVLASSGEVAIADFANHRIQIFDRQGNFQRKFGSKGAEDGQFKY